MAEVCILMRHRYTCVFFFACRQRTSCRIGWSWDDRARTSEARVGGDTPATQWHVTTGKEEEDDGRYGAPGVGAARARDREVSGHTLLMYSSLSLPDSNAVVLSGCRKRGWKFWNNCWNNEKSTTTNSTSSVSIAFGIQQKYIPSQTHAFLL